MRCCNPVLQHLNLREDLSWDLRAKTLYELSQGQFILLWAPGHSLNIKSQNSPFTLNQESLAQEMDQMEAVECGGSCWLSRVTSPIWRQQLFFSSLHSRRAEICFSGPSTQLFPRENLDT